MSPVGMRSLFSISKHIYAYASEAPLQAVAAFGYLEPIAIRSICLGRQDPD